jgi:cytochrome c oxidase assembly factor 6
MGFSSDRSPSVFKGNSTPPPFQMGWFGNTTPEPTAVSREGRQHCWDNRDAYFKCLDNTRVLKPGDEGKACASEKAAYETNCAKSWVRCFH